MVGVGKDPIATDWAKAASQLGEVIGLDVTRHAERLSPGAWIDSRLSISEQEGFHVLTAHLRPAVRPKRLTRPLNHRLAMAPLMEAVAHANSRFGTIDLVHTHRYAGASAVALVAHRKGIPLVHTEHSSAMIRRNPYRSMSRAGLKEASIVYSRAAAVLFVSDQLREAASTYGLSGRFEVVPNPVDGELFRPRVRAPGSMIRLINVGNLIPVKRHQLLLRALALARATEPRLHLEIIGDGPLKASLQETAIRIGLSAAVDLLGPVPKPEVASRLSDADIYVHSSEIETFGVAVVEALSCGLPVVATDSGGVVSTLPSPPVSVVKSDAEALAGAVVKVASELDSYDREEIAADARGTFGFDAVGERLQRIYSDVLGARERI